jgi:glycerol-3-phosphate dehydrogenase (NAD(P)+)
MKNIGVLGEGAWGTAVATLLANNGFTVKLWCHDPAVAQSIRDTRYNKRYLPGIYLDELIIPTFDLSQAVGNASWVFEAIPVKFLRDVLEQVKDVEVSEQKWIILSKGIEQETLLLPSEIIDDVFENHLPKAVLVGPSYAKDLSEKQITAVTLAAVDCDLGLNLQKMLANDYFRPYLSLDMIGAQVGAAIKNVVALAVGMLDGAGYADNAKAFIFTRGLNEMVTIAQSLGGKTKTLYGLSGVGDLVLTATGKQSRNREVGKRLGEGQSLKDILDETGYIPEGINTVNSVYQLMQQKKLDLPVCAGIYEIIHKKKSIPDLLNDLMNRPLEQECSID